jgi:acetyl esterase/lipase
VGLAVGAAVAGVLLNLFGRWTPWRRYPWYLAGMAAGLGGTELGVPLAATQVLAGGLAIGLGAGRSRVGAAGLTVAAGTAAGLVGLHRQVSGAGDVLQRALGEPVASAPEYGKPWAVRDIRYHDGPEHRLDIWRGAVTGADAPVMIYVHGGSWVAGSKRGQGTHLIAELTARGWVCVSIDYRLGPRHRWPSSIGVPSLFLRTW